jgi:hypothetical protein
LSRALCRFEAFTPKNAMLAREAENAALLHAEGRAPFAESEWVVLRSQGGFEIWWWDARMVRTLLASKAFNRPGRFLPESLAQVTSNGWRQVKTADGYEAQYITGNALAASSWRRHPFDANQWRAFVQSAPAPSEPAPINPPAPGPVAWSSGQPWANRLITRHTPSRRVEHAAWIMAAAAMALATALFGHAARYDAIAETHRAAVMAMKADTAASRVVTQTTQNLKLAAAATGASTSPDYLIAVADIFAELADAGIAPTDWQADAATITITAQGRANVEQLAARLEQNPRLDNVAPIRTGDTIVIRADVTGARSALSDGAP